MTRWLVSDHHFGHTNIIKYAERPFDNIDQMNRTLIENHNSVVQDTDKVYFLGDVAMNEKALHQTVPYMKGKKRLILGNHDNLKMKIYARYFERISGSQDLKIPNSKILLTHYPSILDNHTIGRYSLNVHGHIHNHKLNSLSHVCVCVEHTNYFPVSFDSIIKRREL